MRDKSSARLILHLTHTDPRSDSRIRKAMEVARDSFSQAVFGIGFADSRAESNPEESKLRFIFLNEMRKDSRNELSFARRAINWLKVRVGYAGLWFPIAYRRMLKNVLESGELCREVALIHVHDFTALRAGIMLKARTGAKLIYDAHELESGTNGLRRLDSFLIGHGERKLWKHIDGFITVSESIKDHYFSRHEAVPFELVLNSPNSRGKFLKSAELGTIRKETGTPPNKKLFVYLGHLVAGRGIELILEVFDSLPDDFCVAFLGTGDLEDRIRASSLFGSRVHLVEPVNHDLVIQFISDADAGLCLIEPVSLSDCYSLPNKLFECLFAGLPVVASRLPEIESVFERYQVGLLTSLDVEEIRNAIIQVAIGNFTINQSAMKELSWETQSERVRSLYSRFLPSDTSSTL